MKLLLEAAERVQAVTDRASQAAEGRAVVGIGASGDKTIAADRDAEKEILETLKSAGDIRVVSEEAGEMGDPNAEFTAIVDPIDGSANFERGIPFYCTSIGVVRGHRLADAECAVVRNLISGDTYLAERGKGATKNGKKIASSMVDQVAKAFLGADISRAKAETVVELAPLVAASRRLLHYGANALELCLVSEGLLDAFVDVRGKMRIVDFAGAYLIAKEAGAIVTAPDGRVLDPPLDLKSKFGYVASGNEKLHREILGFLRGSSF